MAVGVGGTLSEALALPRQLPNGDDVAADSMATTLMATDATGAKALTLVEKGRSPWVSSALPGAPIRDSQCGPAFCVAIFLLPVSTLG